MSFISMLIKYSTLKPYLRHIFFAHFAQARDRWGPLHPVYINGSIASYLNPNTLYVFKSNGHARAGGAVQCAAGRTYIIRNPICVPQRLTADDVNSAIQEQSLLGQKQEMRDEPMEATDKHSLEMSCKHLGPLVPEYVVLRMC